MFLPFLQLTSHANINRTCSMVIKPSFQCMKDCGIEICSTVNMDKSFALKLEENAFYYNRKFVVNEIFI